MIIYKITNDINNKVYVGQTRRSLRTRWKGHLKDAERGSNYAIHCAIRKYGAEHFHIEQIDIAASLYELDCKEDYWITTLNTLAPNGYNLKQGGKTGRFTEDVLRRKHDALYRKPSGRSKAIECIETGEVMAFAKAFYYKYGYQHSKILECCKGRRNTHRGLHWRYATDEGR